MKYLRWIAFIIIILCLVIALFSIQAYRIKKMTMVTPQVVSTLEDMGSKALETLDVPVGAVLLYENEIIGKGYNRVMRDTNIAAHAEIEAINDAIKRMGWEEFKKLDCKALVMVSTYEPCEMCRGAMIHYDIHKTVFLKDKPFSMWMKTYGRTMLYEFSKRQAKGEGLQDSLFMMHPGYPGR